MTHDDDDVVRAARDVAEAVDGADWDPARVQAATDRMLNASRQARPAALDEALDVLLDRLTRSTPADADGVAHAAISAGSLVEAGASAHRLGVTLLDKLPGVLHAARRYADRCLADLPPLPDEGNDEADDGAGEDAVAEVDRRAIPRSVFRAHLDADRPGGCALAYLREWVLPSVAALTRAPDLLNRAAADADLVGAAAGLRESDAHWLDVLLGVEQRRDWHVLCPVQNRGFRVTLDGIVDNFTLHALLAGALVPLGIPGENVDARTLDYLRGEPDSRPADNGISGSWNLYDYRAAAHDLTRPTEVPDSIWIWGEGRPRDVPPWEGIRTLLLGPPAYQRNWRAGRTFQALRADIQVAAELPQDEVATLLARAARAPSLPDATPDPAPLPERSVPDRITGSAVGLHGPDLDQDSRYRGAVNCCFSAHGS